ncbi:acetate kinase [Xylariaceae sp. FL0255]|nr:acetate kinase [Xylariaceae sp. FL0255]
MAKKIILSINAGSSSVKISAYEASSPQTPPKQLAEASISGLTAPPARLSYALGGKTIEKGNELQNEGGAPPTQDEAFKQILKILTSDSDLPEISHAEDIAIACHRVVHGGSYASPQLITQFTLHHLDKLTDLAPLHNAPALKIVRSCIAELPKTTNIACFDSQFHVSSIPEHVRTYVIDPDVAGRKGLRKYGFHGISYAFITRSVAEFLGKRGKQGGGDAVNIIALHLGSGASACVIKNGKSWDTSMGLTPVAGLPGATRSGNVDPSLVFHYTSEADKLSPSSTKDLHISRAEEILNKESGWKALTGTTNFGEIVSKRDSDERCKLAFDLFIDRICGYIGAYYVSLGGKVDALVFAGGIGEKSDVLRAAVVEKVSCLGFTLDERANGREMPDAGDVVMDISGEGEGNGTHKTLVVRTDEQFEMARSCAEREELWE